MCLYLPTVQYLYKTSHYNTDNDEHDHVAVFFCKMTINGHFPIFPFVKLSVYNTIHLYMGESFQDYS